MEQAREVALALWCWLKVSVVLSGIASLVLVAYVNLVGGWLTIKLPSIQNTCVFDEIITPDPPRRK